VWIEGDSMRREQICTNLLNNANEYTPESRRIELKLCTTAAPGGTTSGQRQLASRRSAP
jgi:signal transduction histidine kinase